MHEQQSTFIKCLFKTAYLFGTALYHQFFFDNNNDDGDGGGDDDDE